MGQGGVELRDGTKKANIIDLSVNDALAVAIVDSNGDQVASFGGGTQYTEDAAAAADPVGPVQILVRKDTPASEVTTDGDNIAQRGTTYGAAYVTLLDTSGVPVSVGGGTQYAEDTVASAGEQMTMAGVVRRDTPTSLVDANGDRTELIVDANGRLHAVEANSSGIAGSVDGIEGLLVTIDADTGVLSGSISTAGSAVPTTGRLAHGSDGTNARALKTDAAGELQVDILSLPALPAGSANIGDVDVLTVPADPFGLNADAASATGSISAKLRFIAATGIPVTSLPNVILAAGTNTNEVVGDVAQDAAVSGNPVQVGWRASTAIPTAMGADGRVVIPWANRSGAPVVCQAPHVGLNSDPWNLQYKAAQYTSQQTSTVLIDAGASEKLVVTKAQIQAGGSTNFDLQIYFGTSSFSRGTSRAVFDGTFLPTATFAPGVVMDGPFISGANADDLKVTTSAAGTVTIGIWYYIVT